MRVMGLPRINAQDFHVLIWLLVLHTSSLTASAALSSDEEILKSLSEQLKGNNGGVSSWNTSTGNPCNWSGIWCDDVQNVINISLPRFHLGGIIPPHVGALQALTALDLSKNSLTGPIPADLSNCTSLLILNLGGNSLHGPIPADLRKLSNLVTLDLSVNSLSGDIPSGLSNLFSLKHLHLSFNNLTGTIPLDLGDLMSLEELSVSQNNLSGAIPPLKQKSLHWVDLASNSLTGPLPSNICASGQLEALILTKNKLNGTLPGDLGSCAMLTSLRVGHNLFHGDIPIEFEQLKNLIYFEADENQLTGRIPSGLSGWKNLSLLNLADNLLTGDLPDKLANLLSIQELRLSNNKLTGNIPHGLSQCEMLSLLDLSENNLAGSIPDDLCSIRKLLALRLQGNFLSGHIPASIGNCGQLLELQLGQNGFTGSIPSTIGNLSNLQVSLNLSTNFLSGTIPASIGTLSRLVSMDLSHNMLSGKIPSMGDMESLLDWNFSYNLLSGAVPQVGSFLNTSSSSYISSYSHNAGLCGGPLPPCGGNAPVSSNRQKAFSFLRWGGIAVSCIGVVVLLLFSGFALALVRSHNKSSAVDPGPSMMVSRVFVGSLMQAVNFDSIKEATQSKANVISSNHFSTMYKAVMPSGLVLAAKSLHSKEKGQVFHQKKMVFELERLWGLSHENIMQPVGYLLHDSVTITLYDFVPVCSLGQRLHKNLEDSLAWQVRFDVAIGAAQGLAFLHSCHPSMVHMDVNSNNIFLGPHSEVKVGDIEVSKLLDPSKHTGSISAVAGSFGYIAPEYAFTMQVTMASNIYSFGVVLLELVTGRLPVDERFGEGLDLVSWVHGASSRGDAPEQILDARVSTQSFPLRQQMLAVLKVAILCTDVSPMKRPKLKKVLEMLLEARMASPSAKLIASS